MIQVGQTSYALPPFFFLNTFNFLAESATFAQPAQPAQPPLKYVRKGLGHSLPYKLQPETGASSSFITHTHHIHTHSLKNHTSLLMLMLSL